MPRCKPGEEEKHLPDIGEFDYLAEQLFECGPDDVTWSSIRDYTELSGVEFTPWEAGTLVKMSKAYTGAVRTFDGVDVERPYTTEEVKQAAITRMQQTIRGRRIKRG